MRENRRHTGGLVAVLTVRAAAVPAVTTGATARGAAGDALAVLADLTSSGVAVREERGVLGEFRVGVWKRVAISEQKGDLYVRARVRKER